VFTTLISRLGTPPNKQEDLELCLNAALVLGEVAECEQLFGKLAESQNLNQLALNACDGSNPHQAYALQAFATILKEYPNHVSSLTEEQKQDFQQAI
jgi:hypothetical protein